MAQKKKLQVFVSSTYEDLKQERQAAVEAILTAGHIPAGMELFAAGDESQMNAIRRWIDESDVYLLILGGRYGSIEPKSQKSYIHLEYEYAIEKVKPLFAVVIDDKYLKEKVKKDGIGIYETENPQKLKEFHALVLSRLVRFYSEPRDIKLAILETMSEFSRRDDLVGWIPGDEGLKSGIMYEEITRLSKENASLREQIAKLPTTHAPSTYNGLIFEELSNLLIQESINVTGLNENYISQFPTYLVNAPNLLALFWFYRDKIAIGVRETEAFFEELKKLISFGIVEFEMRNYTIRLTEDGRKFLTRLRMSGYPGKLKEH